MIKQASTPGARLLPPDHHPVPQSPFQWSEVATAAEARLLPPDHHPVPQSSFRWS